VVAALKLQAHVLKEDAKSTWQKSENANVCLHGL
jgi:hypothetical protein